MRNFKSKNKNMQEGTIVHNGRTYQCECGAELKKVPEGKTSVRRRCKHCRKRWKLIMHENVKWGSSVIEVAAELVLLDHHDKLYQHTPYKENIRIRTKVFPGDD